METERAAGISWEAPEHRHIEKGGDWYWALGILAVAGAVTAIVFGNTLFGIVILLGASTMLVFASTEPRSIPFAVTTRGVRINKQLYPYAALASYHINEEHPDGPQLLIRSERFFMPILILPLPEEHVDEIDEMVGDRLPEEFLEEPVSEKILEFFGF